MKKLLTGLGSVFILVCMAGMANATLVQYDFDGNNKMITLTGATTDELIVTSSGLSVSITAWYYDNSVWQQATGPGVGVYGSSSNKGLGVKSIPGDGAKLDGGKSSNSASDPDEGLLFTFAREVYLRDIDFNSFGAHDDYNLDVDNTNVLTDSRVRYSGDIAALGLSGKEFFIWADGSSDAFYVGNFDVSPVPEPATMLLFGTGLMGLVGTRIRRKKQTDPTPC